MSSSFELRPAERRDLPALTALAMEQAAARQALDARLPAAPHIIPFLSQAATLGDVLSRWHHVTLVAANGGQVVGGINLHRVEQSDHDQFAAYYPRRFTSIGLIAARGDNSAAVLADLLAAARAQAARWKSAALLAHNASADRALRTALEASGHRMFYHYALRLPAPPGGAAAAAGALAVAVNRPEHDRRGVPVPRHAPASASTGAASDDARSVQGFPFKPGPSTPTMPGGVPPSTENLRPKPALEGLSVRHATDSDLNDIVALGLESVRYHASLEPAMHVPRGEDGKMRRRFQEILREPQQGALFVAMLDWQVVGFYSLYVQSIDESWTPPLFAPGRYGLIAEVAVAEGLRGRGIGRVLFQTVAEWFRERGARRLWLIYLPRNPLSSRFWPSLGFEPVWDVMLAGA